MQTNTSDDSEEDRTEPGAKPAPRVAAAPARKATAAATPRAIAKSAPKRSPEPPAAASRPYLAEEPAAAQPDPLEEASRSVDELRAFFRSLTTADRIAAGASLLVIASLALPWRWTKEDEDVIGLVSALPAGILAGTVVALVYVRARRANASLAATLKLAQIGGAVMLTGFCAWFLRSVTDERILRGAGRAITQVLSSPQFGSYIGAACALLVLFASGAALLSDRRS